MPQPYSELIEIATNDLIAAFDVNMPPVPVEIMLQRPKPGMWQQVNLSELSAAFINVRERYSPRMSIARLLVRYICRSTWGADHNLGDLQNDEPAIRAFARTLLMPRQMIAALVESEREPFAISNRFEVPEDDARLRLIDLGYLS
jgi:hypothetical protein